jgi:ribosomal protein S18 acetylase RimI-like enzyme
MYCAPSSTVTRDQPVKLSGATIDHIRELMSWFDSERAVRVWGGPKFHYPYSEEGFISDLGWGRLSSAVLMSSNGQLIGFGQAYKKLNRGHLARLIVSPRHREQGYGRILVKEMMRWATELFSCTECSLFVYRDNERAIQCYQASGFCEACHPELEDSDVIQFMVAPAR